MASAATRPRSATQHRAESSLVARRAAREAILEARRGGGAVRVVLTHQMVQARLAERAVTEMLEEQRTPVRPEARLNPLAFTPPAPVIERMVGATQSEVNLGRLVESLVQDAGRSAESVTIAARPHVKYVRHLTLPSCSRCAILAGRVYRYSTGFERHPNCDCVMLPVTVANPDMLYDIEELARQGLVTGMSKADLQAIRDGADVNQIVNARRNKAGLTESGRVLQRAGRPTPEGIYRATRTREQAVELLTRHGYLI